MSVSLVIPRRASTKSSLVTLSPNRSFDKKAEVKDENGKDIGLKSGNVKINNYLLNKNDWSIDDIKERGDELQKEFLSYIDTIKLQ